jgi:histidine triad (HIT) family protein
MAETLFTQIIKRTVPADIVYEDNKCLAFKDINPQAPTHLLIIPKKVITGIASAESTEQDLLGHLMLTCKKIAAEQGIKHYRLVINNGAEAGQSVFHLHIHLLAGRPFSWPPG